MEIQHTLTDELDKVAREMIAKQVENYGRLYMEMYGNNDVTKYEEQLEQQNKELEKVLTMLDKMQNRNDGELKIKKKIRHRMNISEKKFIW